MRTGRLIRNFIGHLDSVTSVAFSPDGKQALSGSGDRTIKLWDLASGRELRTFTGYADYNTPLVFNHDGKQILTSPAKIWDLTTGQVTKTFSGEISSAVISQDGTQILAGLSSPKGMRDNGASSIKSSI
jgi:WD40 repeat protein